MSHLCFSFSFDNKATCDICHLTRQKKLTFNSNQSIPSNKFELLHFDIWGLLVIPYVHNHKYFLIILDDHASFVSYYLKPKYKYHYMSTNSLP